MHQLVSDVYQMIIAKLQRLTLAIEKALNVIFTQKYNPFYYHGALPNFFLWVLFLSGLLLFAYFNPTVARAFDSIEYMTNGIPSGALFRAIHRYAADGMMIFVLLHFLRVWWTDRYREYRILPWITGVILLIVTFLAGLTGYMLIWDDSSVTLIDITRSLLHAVPVIGAGLDQLLIGGPNVTDVTLIRILFLHFGIPSSMMFLLWWHYMRITRPVTTAPFTLNILLFGGLLVVCGTMTELLQLGKPANFNVPSGTLLVDWLFMLPQAMVANGTSLMAAWTATLAVPVAMLLLPYMQKKTLPGQYAQVINDNCTGCQMCYHDCPYEAITMVDRDDDTKFKRLAIVDAGRCSNCGLCVGACAFKAIEVPRRETERVFDDIEAALARS